MSILNTSRKFRIFPNKEQMKIINNTFGCCRFVWNKLLEKTIESYDKSNKSNIPIYGELIKEYPFLNDKNLKIDRHAVNNVRHFLTSSFSKFFRDIKKHKPNMKMRKDGRPRGFPKFKSNKHGKNSYTNYHSEHIRIDWNNRIIKIPVVGWVKFSIREKQIPDNWILKHITVSKSHNGKYYISICYQYEDTRIGIDGVGFNLNPKSELKVLGLDYSSKSLYVDSNGDEANYPKYYRRSLKNIRMLNKQFFRRKKGSNNWNKTKQKLAMLHEHISNQRKDFLHKLSNLITKDYDIIVVEDLDMKSMSQCLKLGKSTMDNSFGMFRKKMLRYKMKRQPFKIFHVIDKWFPSSKMCSCCGCIKKELKLSDRVYHCNECGLTIDRDLNAAINIKNKGIADINKIFEDIRVFQFV